jgi:putative DNA primase/helicase
MTAYEWLTKYLAITGSARVGQMWQCPAHKDSSPSLSVTEGPKGIVLLKCHAGCTYAEILTALGLGGVTLFKAHPWSPEKVFPLQHMRPEYVRLGTHQGTRKQRRQQIGEIHHAYTTTVRLCRIRFADGSKLPLWQVLEDGTWKFSQGLKVSRLPLYNESEVAKGICIGEYVVLCESESSVDALLARGIYATTWAGGASTPNLKRLREVLTDANVLWVPDNDLAGRRCTELLERELKPHVQNWKTLCGEEGEDARDLVTKNLLTLSYMFSLAA